MMMPSLGRIVRWMEGISRPRVHRGLEILPGEIRFLELRETKDHLRRITSNIVIPQDLNRAAREGRWFERGIRVAHCDVPLWIEPPPDDRSGSRAAWEERTRPPVDTSSRLDSIFQASDAPQFAAWIHLEKLQSLLDDSALPNSLDSISASILLLAQLLGPGGIPGRWIAWRIFANGGMAWWMRDGVICHACTLQGGSDDFPLLEADLRSMLTDPMPHGWELAPVALLEDLVSERIRSIIHECHRESVSFPWHSRWNGIPIEYRFAAAAACGSTDGVLDESLDGPLRQDMLDRARAIRWSLAGCMVLLAGGFLWAAILVAQGATYKQCETLEHRLEPDRIWLRSLDSLRRSGIRPNSTVPASRFLAEGTRCLPAEAWLQEWSAAGMPRHHSLVVQALNEPAITALVACLDSTQVFARPAVRSMEVRTRKATELQMWGVGPGNVWSVRLDVPEELQ